jgi:hypothetical protein
MVYLAHLFSSLMIHGVPPHDFLASTVIPILKGRNVIASDSSNFRSIAYLNFEAISQFNNI